MWRLNPTITRPILEALIKRDVYGQRRTAWQQIPDFFVGHTPLPVQGMIGKREMTLVQSVLQSMGVATYEHRTDLDKEIMQHFIDHRIDYPGDSIDKQVSLLRTRSTRLMREGDKQGAMELIREAAQEYHVPPKTLVGWVKKSVIDKQVASFAQLPIDVQVRVWKFASRQEKLKLLPVLSQKISKATTEGMGKTIRELQQ
jgi:hypothetical protein